MTDEQADLVTWARNTARRNHQTVTETVDQVQQGMPGRAPARERITAARHVHNHAGDLLADAVLDARGAGETWHEIGVTMEMATTEDGTPPGTQAFEWSLGRTKLTSAYWTSHTCENVVADDGPYDANPAMVEHGHTRECSRAARDAEQYRQMLAEAGMH